MTIAQLINKYGSQSKVAEVLGVSESYINKVYNGRKKITLQLLIKISKSQNEKLWKVVKENEEKGLI
jgi:plasmid maintenance system antidote protein VapI